MFVFIKNTTYYYLFDWCCTCLEYTGYASEDREASRGDCEGGYGGPDGFGQSKWVARDEETGCDIGEGPEEIGPDVNC